MDEGQVPWREFKDVNNVILRRKYCYTVTL